VAGSPYAIVPSAAVGTGLSNYTISYTNGTLTVNAAALLITANSASKTYGQTVAFAGTEFSSSGLVNGDTVASVTLTSGGAAATATVAGSPYAIVPSAAVGTGLSNYTISYSNGALTVSTAMLSVTANDASKTYGQTLAFQGTEFTTSGLVNSDTVASVTLTSAGAADTATVAGSPYTITASDAVGIGLSNYTISYVPGALTVGKATPTVTLSADNNPVVFGQNVTFTATVTPPAAGTPTGTINFFDAATLLGNASLTAGVATLSSASLAVGKHTITASYTGDSNFDSGDPGTATEEVDDITPVITLNEDPPPNQAGWNNTNVAITWTVTDPGAILPSTRTGCDTTTLSTSTSLTCSATSAGGTITTSKSVTVQIDKVAPTVTITGGPPQYTKETVVQITGKVSDEAGGSGIASAAVLLDGHPVGGPLSVADDGSVVRSVTVSGDGPHSITLTATDVAGNASADATTTFILDTTPPEVTIQSPADNVAVGTSSVTVTAHVVDATPTTVVIGNESVVPNPAGLASATVGLQPGYNTITVGATDSAGNSSATQTITVLYDNAAPLISSDIADGTSFGPLVGDLLPWKVTVYDLGTTQGVFSFGGSFDLPRGGGFDQTAVPLTEGLNNFNVAVTNEVGSSAQLFRTVVYDKTPPTVTFISPAAGAAVRGAIDVSVNASDNLTGVASVAFAMDNTPLAPALASGNVWSTTNVDTTAFTDGGHTLTAVVLDGVGNETTRTLNIVIDNTAPVASVAYSPSNGQYVKGTITITAAGQDATSGVATIVIKVNGTQVGSCAPQSPSSSCPVSFDTTTLPDGPFTILATVTDAAGNSATPQTTAIADNTLPANFLMSPTNGQIVTTSMQVTVNVTQNYFAYVDCFVDGVSVGHSTNPQFSTTVSLAGRLDGPVTTSCTACDLAGGCSTQTVTVLERNWAITVNPRTLNLRSKSTDNAVTVIVEGANVSLLIPVSSRALTLRPVGGTAIPVQATFPGSQAVGDSNKNRIPDVLLKFDRQAFINSINGGISATTIDPTKPLTVQLLSAGSVIGSDTITITQ
jgi:hypothetical protein